MTTADQRSLTKIERHAGEVLRQVRFLRANSIHGDDTLRFLLIHGKAQSLAREAALAERRYWRRVEAANERTGQDG